MRLLTILYAVALEIVVVILIFILIPSSSGQSTSVSYLPSPILLNLERCSGSAALASDCTGILRVKIRLTDGSQLLLWGIPAPEAWATSAPEIVWTPVK